MKLSRGFFGKEMNLVVVAKHVENRVGNEAPILRTEISALAEEFLRNSVGGFLPPLDQVEQLKDMADE